MEIVSWVLAVGSVGDDRFAYFDCRASTANSKHAIYRHIPIEHNAINLNIGARCPHHFPAKLTATSLYYRARPVAYKFGTTLNNQRLARIDQIGSFREIDRCPLISCTIQSLLYNRCIIRLAVAFSSKVLNVNYSTSRISMNQCCKRSREEHNYYYDESY
ncbi:hypothetical protein D3C81_1482660 [compost metagenome]